MIVNMYCVKDEVSEEFGTIGTAKNHKAAMREYLRQVVDKKLDEKEYGIYLIGVFDTENGIINMVDPVNLRDVIIEDVED